MKDSYKFRGDYVLTDLTVESRTGIQLGLLGQFIELNIYESIFNNTLTGNVVLSDSLNLIEKLPLVGNEKIKIRFHTAAKEDAAFDREFIVYKVSAPAQTKERNKVYALFFCSVEAIIDQSIVINESFSGTTSDIANEIFGRLGSNKEFDVEETKGIQNMISPNWHPFEFVNWLTSKSISTEQNKNGFLFYEDKNGFNFKSVQTLYQSSSDIEFFQNQQEALTLDAYLEMEFIEPKGILSKLNDGVLANRKYSYDLSTRQYSFTDYDYIEDFNPETSLDKNPLPYNLEVNFVEGNVSTGYVQSDCYGEGVCSYGDSQKFKSIVKQINNSGVTILVGGNSALTVGYKVKINIPSNEFIKNEPKRYEIYGGNMLIAELKHTIKPEGYFQTITLLKDSYGTTENDT